MATGEIPNDSPKGAESHIAAVSLYTMFYNFARIHKTLRVTPRRSA